MVSTDLLRQFDFFQGFSEEQIKKLADIATEESYKAGFQLWRKGDPAKTFYLVEGGKVVLSMENYMGTVRPPAYLVEGGKAGMSMETYMGTARPPAQVTVDIITKGDAMGWSAVIEPYVYTLGARCIADSKAIAFDGAKLRELLNKDIKLGYAFMHATAKVIATRLTHTEIILIGERGLLYNDR
ncbi:MAG: cyclic nucleotide-binding domain-containing protein [Syntrophales bacterium]|jgi:CRP-like cAMP-binding protein